MGDLFNDDGAFRPDVAASLSDAELNAAIALLELDHERALDAYRAAERLSRTAEKTALRDVSNRLAAVRSWVRARGEAAGTRSPAAAIVTGDN